MKGRSVQEEMEKSSATIQRVEISDGGGVFSVETDRQGEALKLLARLIARGLKQEGLAREAQTGQPMVPAGPAGGRGE